MTGMLIGLALLIVGGAMHDENYQPNDPRLRQVGPDRWSDRREGAGYAMGMAGGAILAWHLHEYLEERIGGELPIRLGLGRALVGGLVGGGLVGIGLIVHNDDARGDRDRRYSYKAQRTNDYREHLGFLLGPLGGATAALSIKGYRKRSDARQVEMYRSASLLRYPYVRGEPFPSATSTKPTTRAIPRSGGWVVLGPRPRLVTAVLSQTGIRFPGL